MYTYICVYLHFILSQGYDLAVDLGVAASASWPAKASITFASNCTRCLALECFCVAVSWQVILDPSWTVALHLPALPYTLPKPYPALRLDVECSVSIHRSATD